ncbi:MAG: RimK family alpha-L-glutamate ligase [DPANN group archaeon]|nr:RimK family alpha-L-glutamate ligase [DPANN group archaeon]
MNKILIASPGKLSTTTRMIIDEAKKVFNVKYVPINRMNLIVDKDKIRCEYNRQDLTNVDYFLPKIDAPRKEYGYQIIKAFDFFDVPKPYKAETILIAHDKFLTTELLARNKICVPKTYLFKTGENSEEMVDIIKFPIMVKLKGGSGGKGIMYVKESNTMKSILKSMEVLKQEVLIQEFIDNPGEDIRVLIVGGEIAGAYKRVAKEGEKRANIKIGGTGVRYTPTKEVEEISLKVAEIMNCKILAVDILESKDGPVVIEVNLNPGIKGMTEATDINIAKRIIDYIETQVKR